MPQVSKRVLNKNIEKKIKENFLEALASLKDKKLAYRFIYDFLTPTERVMLAKSQHCYNFKHCYVDEI